jgi:perosamine synthetase
MPTLIRSSKPIFPKEDLTPLLIDIAKVLEEGQFRNGQNVVKFEDLVAEYIGIAGAVAFDSDSSAYETALRFFGAHDHEVVVCTNSFVSVPNSVVAVGARVVFADIRADTLSMDPESLQKNISPKTRGVIVTHIAGFPNPDLQAITKICKEHDLFLIEDATHAIGATVHNKKVGRFGDAAVFAFTPTKVITTGEGGMLISSNTELCRFAKGYRFYGSGVGKTNFVDLGRHMVLPEVSAILGIYQLKRLEEFIVRRNMIARRYDESFERMDTARIVKCPENNRSSYYKYPLILDAKIDKPKLTRLLLEEFGIETGNIFYPPCHLQPSYKKSGALSYGSLSTAETVLSRTITLPMHFGLTDEDVDFVIEKTTSLCAQ